MDCLGQRALPHRAGICCTCGRTKRLCSVTASLGRRKNLCMVESMSSVEQRLRRVTNHKCDLCLCRDDAFDAQTTCCLILFKQALSADHAGDHALHEVDNTVTEGVTVWYDIDSCG